MPGRGQSRRRAGRERSPPGPTASASRCRHGMHILAAAIVTWRYHPPCVQRTRRFPGLRLLRHADTWSFVFQTHIPWAGRCGTWRRTSASPRSNGQRAVSKAAATRRNRTSSGRPNSCCTSAGAALCGCPHSRAPSSKPLAALWAHTAVRHDATDLCSVLSQCREPNILPAPQVARVTARQTQGSSMQRELHRELQTVATFDMATAILVSWLELVYPRCSTIHRCLCKAFAVSGRPRIGLQ